MACNTCQPTKSIPVCTQLLVLGTITPDLDVFIFVTNNTTGYQHRQPAISDNNGLIKLDLSIPDPSFYNPDSSYDVWITTQNSGPNEKLPINISAQDFDCLSLSFNPLYDEDNDNVSYPEVTLEIL